MSHSVKDEHDGKGFVSQPRATPVLIPPDVPLIVLIDGDSASCSEEVAGTISKTHRGTLVGKPSIGKGEGQLFILLPFGRSLDLVNEVFYPSGKDIRWAGVTPHIMVDNKGRFTMGDLKSDKQLRVAFGQAVREAADKERRDRTNKKSLRTRKQQWEWQLKHPAESDD